MRTFQILRASAAVGALMYNFSGAYAQDTVQPPAAAEETQTMDAGRGIEDIVVTARRVEERLQSIPIQITAIGSEQLRDSLVQRTDDLKFLAPSLQVSGTGVGGQGAFADFSLRGNSRQLNTDVVVQPYWNEMPVNTIGLNYQYYDLESVQILEGPQGVAFGKNSTGGAVLYQTQRPRDTFEAFAEATVGNYSHREFTGMINVPLVADKLSMRIAGNVQKRDGVIKNIIGPDLFDRNHWSIRGSLRFTPTDAITNELVVDYFHQNESSGNNGAGAGGNKILDVTLPAVTGAGNCQGVPFGGTGLQATAQFTARQHCFFSSRNILGQPVGNIPMTPEQIAIYGVLPYFEGTGQPGSGPSTPLGDLWFQHNLLLSIAGDERVSIANPVPYQPGKSYGFVNATRFDIGETPLGEMSVKNIVGYRRNEVFANALYGPPIFVGLIGSGGPLKTTTFTEEFQVLGDIDDGALSWLVGGFYANDKRAQSAFYLPTTEQTPTGLQSIPQAQLNFLYDVSAGGAQQFERNTFARYKVESSAIYGRLIVKPFSLWDSAPAFLANLRVTGGYRKSWDKSSTSLVAPVVRFVTGNVQSGPLFVPGVDTPRQRIGCNFFLPSGQQVSTAPASEFIGPCERGGTRSWSSPNWEIGVDTQITDRIMVYAKRSRGYKAGGANSFNTSGKLFYDPEFTTANEIGIKTDWQIGQVALRLNGTWYDTDYTNQQFNQLTFNPINNQFETTITNDATSKIRGWSIQSQIAPFRNLRLSYAYANFDNVYLVQPVFFASPTSPFNCTSTPTPVCRNVPYAGPHNTHSVQGSYTLPLGDRVGEVVLTADYYHQDENISISTNTGLPTVQDAYQTINASLSWNGIFGSRFDARVWVRNLTDELGASTTDSRTVGVFSNIQTAYKLEPRMFGLTLRYSFGD